MLHGHSAPDESNTRSWWPNSLNLKPLAGTDPTAGANYAADFLTLDLDAVHADIVKIMRTSQDWWPADYGHYGPFFIRMAWHSAGTYRTFDGRGGSGSGMLRFAPLNSWPDNGNLDKARRLLWPIKQKYGRKLSWGDLMIFAGNVALEDMGFKTFGFAGGRVDAWEPEDVYWGPENEWLQNRPNGDKLAKPLGATMMGLIYVNPEGPGGNSDPISAAHDIRTTFGRMAMNDEETVALCAGGHTFGKGHGAADPDKYVGVEPEAAGITEQGLGWRNTFRSGKGAHTITSGLEGAWTVDPTKWDNGYFVNLFKYDWKQSTTPAGATLWVPTDESAARVRDAHDPGVSHLPVMFTTDLSLRMDPAYEQVSRRFKDDPQAFADAFGRAWYKLTHRDMGPHVRLLGAQVPPPQLWQDPCPLPDPRRVIGASEIAELKSAVLADSFCVPPRELVRTAWAAASTYRKTDKRGGANGARIRLSPMKDWDANDPEELSATLAALETVQATFNRAHVATPVSLADLIVLAGCAAVEAAAGGGVEVPFTPGRTDATPEMTDAESFDVLEPVADGFRNYLSPDAVDSSAPPEALLVGKASMLDLSMPEMAVLVAGLRALDANAGHSQAGVLTHTPGVLTADFFTAQMDMGLDWRPLVGGGEQLFEGMDRVTGEAKWVASRVDLIFGSNSQLRAVAEYYACEDARDVFVGAFVNAWSKVMDLDRFDLQHAPTLGAEIRSRL